MRPRKPFPADSVVKLQDLLRQATCVADARRIQAVLMRALEDSTPEKIASVVGLSVATVRSLHSRFIREGISCLEDRPGRGGCRRQVINDAELSKLLAQFVDSSKIGGIVSAAQIRLALEKAVGHRIAASTVYRLLAKSGWRKVVPRPHHPKRDLANIEPFKKNSRKSSQKNVKP